MTSVGPVSSNRAQQAKSPSVPRANGQAGNAASSSSAAASGASVNPNQLMMQLFGQMMSMMMNMMRQGISGQNTNGQSLNGQPGGAQLASNQGGNAGASTQLPQQTTGGINSSFAANNASTGSVQGGCGCSNAGNVQSSSNASTVNSSGNAGNVGAGTASQQARSMTTDPTLQRTLETIGRDPEGAKLLQAASRNGVRVQSRPDNGSGPTDFFQRSTNTITVSNPNDVKTLAHELVHAATNTPGNASTAISGNGNSRREEGNAEVIGQRIAARTSGRQMPNERQVFNDFIKNYPELRQDNGIDQALRNLGIAPAQV